jgi:drug/metabolite transporter (DMT)-like permease
VKGATLAAGAVAFTVVAWGSVFPLIRIALHDLAPLPLAAARFAVAGVLAVALLAVARARRPTVADAVRFVGCGAIGMALFNIMLNAGERTVSGGAAGFIIGAVPAITAVLATLFLRERFTRWAWAGTAISFAGVGLIAADQPGGLSFGTGATLVLGAAACQATYFILLRPLVPRYGALASSAYTLLAAAFVLSPWMAEAAGVLASPATARATIVAVTALGVFPAALGYATWAYALGHFGAPRAANFLYLVAPVATCLAFLWLGEVPGFRTLIGGAVAIAGIALVNTRGRSASQLILSKVALVRKEPMVTCMLRYIIDPYKVAEFEAYGKEWIRLVNRSGGTHNGYFLPSEGADNVAFAIFTFPSLATYEAYRNLFSTDPEFLAATRVREESRCIVSYERTFLRPVFE